MTTERMETGVTATTEVWSVGVEAMVDTGGRCAEGGFLVSFGEGCCATGGGRRGDSVHGGGGG